MATLSRFLPILLAAAISGAASAGQAQSPPPSIDSILQGLGPDQATDAPEDVPSPARPAPGPTPPTPGPVPYSEADVRAYDQAIRAAAQAAQGRAGPLDGAWTVTGHDGQEIYRFRFSDRGFGLALAEGAWRDLRAPRGGDSGFVSSVGYDGDRLMLRFYESGPDDLVVLNLRQNPNGAWMGELWRAGAVTQVTFRHYRG